MSGHSDENEDLTASSHTENETDLVSMIKRMQQQLNFLEKKIDLLVGQSQGDSFGNREKRFSKPFRPSFGGGHHHGKRDFHRGPRREGFSHDRPPREEGFSHDRPRDKGFGQKRHFDKPSGQGHGGFGRGDKPFFRHRKGPR